MDPPLSIATLRARAKHHHEPDWLVDARVDAFERATQMDAPRWRRTELADVDLDARIARASHGPPTPRASGVPKGVILMPLAEAAREHPDLVRSAMAIHPRADKWEILQTALWSSGRLVHVERGVEVTEPLQLTERLPAHGALVRDVVVLERQSKATLFARQAGASATSVVLAGLEVEVRDGASLSLSSMQDLDPGVVLLGARRATLRRDATLSWTDGQFGAGTAVVVNETTLEGQGSTLRFIGAFFGSHGQHMDVTNSAFHEGMHTSSKLDMKGALNEDGYSANYSIVNIGPHAKNASGHQHQETLILSPGARADAIPKLDVENNDVSASHGATVGQVDPEQIFYLQARGFSELAAKRLIVEGFFDPLLREVPIDRVRDEIGEALVGRLKE